jgi:hypothetical protein
MTDAIIEKIAEAIIDACFIYPDEATAAARAAYAVMERAQWRQPIDTAPKDGTKIDIWLSTGERIPDCYWHKDAWRYWGISEYGDLTHVRIRGEPTHYMRQPSPPASEPPPPQ